MDIIIVRYGASALMFSNANAYVTFSLLLVLCVFECNNCSATPQGLCEPCHRHICIAGSHHHCVSLRLKLGYVRVLSSMFAVCVSLCLMMMKLSDCMPFACAVVVAPDGSTVTVGSYLWYGTTYYLNVYVTPSPLRFGGMAGLCGTNDGNATNDLSGQWNNITGAFPCSPGATTNAAGVTWAVPDSENLFYNPSAAIAPLNSSIFNGSNPASFGLSWLSMGACINGQSSQVPNVTVRVSVTVVFLCACVCVRAIVGVRVGWWEMLRGT